MLNSYHAMGGEYRLNNDDHTLGSSAPRRRSLPFNVMSQDVPSYPSWEGRPDGAGRVLPK